MAQIIDGKKISQDIKDELKEKVTALKDTGTEVALAVIQVGNDPASSVYVRNKKRPASILVSGPYPMNSRRRQPKMH